MVRRTEPLNVIWQTVHVGFGYFQREAGYTRTGSHAKRVNGRETASGTRRTWRWRTGCSTPPDGKWRAPDSLGYPVYAVELEPEVTPEARRWSASQARAFLASMQDDPLGPPFRIVLPRGARRGEASGLRRADADLDAGYARVRRPLVLVRGAVTESTPKTKTGGRLIWPDAETVRILKEHRTAQLKARLMAGESWQDNDLIFCQGDGAPYKPDTVTRRFQRLAVLAGLPAIKLREGRH